MSVVPHSVMVLKKEPPGRYAEAIAALAEGNDLARMGEVLQATSIATICDEYQIDEDVAGATAEQILFYGADGTASVGEFVALEVSAVLGISPGSAINRIAQVLNVRDRHPVLWEAMLAGAIPLRPGRSGARPIWGMWGTCRGSSTGRRRLGRFGSIRSGQGCSTGATSQVTSSSSPEKHHQTPDPW